MNLSVIIIIIYCIVKFRGVSLFLESDARYCWLVPSCGYICSTVKKGGSFSSITSPFLLCGRNPGIIPGNWGRH